MKTKWFQLVIEDPLSVPGKNIIPLLHLFMQIEDVKFCVLHNIDGGGVGIYWFHEHIHELIPIEIILDRLPEVSQFVWCDMFMFKEPKKPSSMDLGLQYPALIEKTNLTLRMVDNTYFYIYTTNARLASILQSTYTVESCTQDYLENFVHPD